jgi:ribose/xylose/arabinose/galactoside ABC-type transport system permease subunit
MILHRFERLRSGLRRSAMAIILMVLCAALAVQAQGFFTTDNLLIVLRNVSMQGVIAFGMTMVIIAGEIDLSVGSAVALSGCLVAWLTGFLAGPPIGMPMPWAVTLAILASLTLGAMVGAVTGLLRVRFGVPTFIATLAWMTILKGAAELITNGFPLMPFPPWYNFIGGGYVGIIPFPAIIFLLVFAATHFLMNYTSFGQAVYAVGGNAEAARLSGIRVGRVKILAMGIVAGLAALSGVMQSSQLIAGRPDTGTGWELNVISAVIIGGTSLMGGSGTVWGTLIGVVFLGVLGNGMTLMNISEYWQHVVQGALILAAVLINMAPSARK